MMRQERAFDAWIDMAKRDIASMNGMNAQIVQRNLGAGIHNALSHVEPSKDVPAALGRIDEAFRQVIVEMDKLPMGIGTSDRLTSAKEAMARELDHLRAVLDLCPSSAMSRALGLS